MQDILDLDSIPFSDNSILYGIDVTGNEVSINDVPNGIACECTCPCCHRRLVAKKEGTKRKPHFAHYAEDVKDPRFERCNYEFWRSLHYLTYRWLERHQALLMPSLDIQINEKIGDQPPYQVTRPIWPAGQTPLKSIELKRIDQRKHDDIVVTLHGEEVIVYPDIPVRGRLALEELKKSWRNRPLLIIEFSEKVKPEKDAEFNLQYFFHELQHTALRRWVNPPQAFLQAAAEINPGYQQWRSEAECKHQAWLEKHALNFLQQGSLNSKHIGIDKHLAIRFRSPAELNLNNAALTTTTPTHCEITIPAGDTEYLAVLCHEQQIEAVQQLAWPGHKAVILVTPYDQKSPANWPKTWHYPHVKEPTPSESEPPATDDTVEHPVSVPQAMTLNDAKSHLAQLLQGQKLTETQLQDICQVLRKEGYIIPDEFTAFTLWLQDLHLMKYGQPPHLTERVNHYLQQDDYWSQAFFSWLESNDLYAKATEHVSEADQEPVLFLILEFSPRRHYDLATEILIASESPDASPAYG